MADRCKGTLFALQASGFLARSPIKQDVTARVRKESKSAGAQPSGVPTEDAAKQDTVRDAHTEYLDRYALFFHAFQAFFLTLSRCVNKKPWGAQKTWTFWRHGAAFTSLRAQAKLSGNILAIAYSFLRLSTNLMICIQSFLETHQPQSLLGSRLAALSFSVAYNLQVCTLQTRPWLEQTLLAYA